MKFTPNSKEIPMSSSVRVGLPLNPTLDGCDYCYRPARLLRPVAVVPHLGRRGHVCESCHGELTPKR
jgi:hypothetical protein